MNQDGVRRSVHELLAYPDLDLERLAAIWPELGSLSAPIAEQLEIDAKYAGYLDRQDLDIQSFRKDEQLVLPDTLDYRAIGGLSTEVRQKLESIRPRTLGQAARIDGVTPAALTLLLGHVKRGRHNDRRSA